MRVLKNEKNVTSWGLKEEITSVFEALLNELNDLIEVESNVCLGDVQQLQPFVLDPKRPVASSGRNPYNRNTTTLLNFRIAGSKTYCLQISYWY